MATVTTPDNIAAADDSDAYDPPAAYAALATSVQLAFNKREAYTFLWADAAARTAETDMVATSLGFQQDNLATYIYTGTTWKLWHTAQPIAFTPTWTNLTVGNAVQLWSYTVAAGRVGVSGFITLGSTSSVGSNPYMTPPLPMNNYITSAPASGNDRWLGGCSLNDLSTAYYRGDIETFGTGGVIYARLLANNAAATHTTIQGLTSTIPFTWANGDYITADYSYIAD